MKTSHGKAPSVALIYFFILTAMVHGTALAGVRLDLGSAPLDPAVDVVYPGDTVQIPIFLTNYSGGPVITATSNKITYDSTYLTALAPSLGPQGVAAEKNLSYSINTPGQYMLGVYGIVSLNTPIQNGIVAYARFQVHNNSPAQTYQLGNTPDCTALEGSDIPTSGLGGFIEVSEPATTTMPSSTTTTLTQETCSVVINPSAVSVASTETVLFTPTGANTACGKPQPEWSVDSAIGSTIDANGAYTAGENTTGVEAVDSVLVTDTANNASAQAAVRVSALPVGAITGIAPAAIRSSIWRPRLHVLIVHSELGNFTSKSELKFSPAGDIQPLITIGSGRVLVAIISVKTDVKGLYDVLIYTDTMIFIKNEALSVSIPVLF